MNTLVKERVENYTVIWSSKDAQKVQVALAKTGRSSNIVLQGKPPPTYPISNGEWDLKPVLEEEALPLEVQRRINIIKRTGVPIKSILIAHELPPPKKVEEIPPPIYEPSVASPEPFRTTSKPKTGTTHIPNVLKAVAIGGAIFAGFVAVIALAAVMAVAAFLLAPLLMVVAMVALAPLWAVYDPVVFVVLDDENMTWIQVADWYE